MFNGFNFNEKDECNCPECRIGNSQVQADVSAIDLTFNDPAELLNEYFEEIKSVRSGDELYVLLAEFMSEACKNAVKEQVVNDILEKIELLQAIETDEEFEDEY